jgi:hypothetical protein
LRFVRDRFKNEPGLEIVPTSEVLPKSIEKQRRMWQSWRGEIKKRIGWRLGFNSGYFNGWKSQQIVKLEALSGLHTEIGVFLDSDFMMCSTIAPEYFTTADGRLRLLETKACNYEDYVFETSRQILLKASLLDPAKAFNYIHQVPRFYKRTAVKLLNHLSKIHKDWHYSFLHQEYPSEYALLGYAARELEHYKDYFVEDSPPNEWCYSVKTKDSLLPSLELCRKEGGRRKFLLIQSNIGMSVNEYMPLANELIDELAKTKKDQQLGFKTDALKRLDPNYHEQNSKC